MGAAVGRAGRVWTKSKDSPLARFTRTVALALVGLLGSRETLDLLTDYNTNSKLVALQVIAALIAGGLAYLQAYNDVLNVSTPTGKALKQFLQLFLAGAATLVVADLTGAAALAFANALWSLVYTSLLSAVAVFLTNKTEDANA